MGTDLRRLRIATRLARNTASGSKWVRWFIRIVTTTAIAVSTGIVALDSSSLPAEDWWRPPGWLTLAAIITISFGVLWSYFDAEIERRRVRRRNSITSEIHRLSTPMWRKIQGAVRDRKVTDRIGLHVWMVPTWQWLALPGWTRHLVPRLLRDRWRTPPMWRAMLIRMKDGHESTQIPWRRDVGAIGFAWRQRTHVYYDLLAMWGATEIPATTWATMTHDDRLGLTHAQYVAVRKKYATVLVAPIYQNPDEGDSRLIGCIVIDSLVDFPWNLDVRRIRNIAFLLAQNISASIKAVS
jgi:hypothetical protein